MSSPGKSQPRMEKKIDAAVKALESINEDIASALKTSKEKMAPGSSVYEDSDSDDGIETHMFDGAMINGEVNHSEDSRWKNLSLPYLTI